MIIEETNLTFTSLTKRTTTKRIFYHHSGANNSTVISMHKYHKDTLKWSGIGYHFIILQNGTIQRGRPLEMIGAHATNNNFDSIGICLVGDFENGNVPTEEQYKSCIELTRYLLDLYHLTTSALHRHNEVCATICPADFDLERVKKSLNNNEAVTVSNNIEVNRTLKKGSQGEQVRQLQKLLNKRFLIGLEEDGEFGIITEQAVKLFQAVNGLTVDGIVGERTQEKLKGV